ncbi:MAG: hypothetical protein EXR27_13665 [Betaproteobacteria bacterium]|nr:hypothetical protein [Betaproteobacteria bacterium]
MTNNSPIPGHGEIRQELGTHEVGGLWPENGFLSAILDLKSDGQKGFDRAYQQQLLLERGFEFSADLCASINSLAYEIPIPDGCYPLISISVGACYLDLGYLKTEYQGHAHKIVAHLSGNTINSVGHLSKFKSDFKPLFKRMNWCANTAGIACVVDTNEFDDESLRRSWGKGNWKFLARTKHGVVYQLKGQFAKKTSPAKTHSFPVLAIDIDIGRSSEASMERPDVLSVYRARLQQHLTRLRQFKLFAGVWSGDGLKLLREMPVDTSRWRGLLGDILKQLLDIMVELGRVRGENSTHYLRIGLAVEDESPYIGAVLLGQDWDNPEVDRCDSVALRCAESAQMTSKKYAEAGGSNRDILAVMSTKAGVLEAVEKHLEAVEKRLNADEKRLNAVKKYPEDQKDSPRYGGKLLLSGDRQLILWSNCKLPSDIGPEVKPLGGRPPKV